MCVSIMIAICIKQHLNNICNSIHKKVKQHWGWVEKSVAYKEKRVYVLFVLPIQLGVLSEKYLLKNAFPIVA